MKTLKLSKVPASYWARITLFVVLLLIAISLSSCGTFKRAVNKEKHKEETKTEIEKKTETETNTETATTKTTTEEFTAPVIIPSDTILNESELDKLLNGEETEFENDEVKIITKIDSGKVKTKVITKQKKIQVPGKRTIIENTIIKEGKKENTDIKEKTTSKVIDKSKVKESEADTGLPWYVWVLFLLLFFLIVWMVLKRYKIL